MSHGHQKEPRNFLFGLSRLLASFVSVPGLHATAPCRVINIRYFQDGAHRNMAPVSTAEIYSPLQRNLESLSRFCVSNSLLPLPDHPPVALRRTEYSFATFTRGLLTPVTVFPLIDERSTARSLGCLLYSWTNPRPGHSFNVASPWRTKFCQGWHMILPHSLPTTTNRRKPKDCPELENNQNRHRAPWE